MASIIPAVITGGASVLGAGVSSLGGKSAANTQAKTASNALDFAKQQEAQRKSAYDQSMQLYQHQWQAQQARKDALLKYYGFDTSSLPGVSTVGATPSAGGGATGTPANPGAGFPSMTPLAQPRTMPYASANQTTTSPSSITSLMGQQSPAPAASGTGGVFDWSRYGLEPARMA